MVSLENEGGFLYPYPVNLYSILCSASSHSVFIKISFPSFLIPMIRLHVLFGGIGRIIFQSLNAISWSIIQVNWS